MRVFEDRVLRNILRPRRGEVTGSGEDYIRRSFTICTPHRILFGIKPRRMELVEHVARMGNKRGAYRVLGGKKPERKRPLGKLRRKWEYNIKMDLEDVGLEGMDWINLAQGRNEWRALLKGGMNFWVP